MKNGPESLAAAAGGNNVATGGNAVAPATRIPVNFPVIENNEIQIFGEMCGTDIGGMGVGVEIEFSDVAGPGSEENKTVTVEGDLATVDLRTALTTQGSQTSPSVIVPAGYTKIEKIVVAAASDGLADGKQTFFIRLGGNAVMGGEQNLLVSAMGRIAVQSGSDSAPEHMGPLVKDNLDIEVRPGDTFAVDAEGAGNDGGTGYAVVTVIFGK